MADVVMPQMGESIAEGTIVRWIKKVGDSVDRDEPLFEISTDKVDAEIPSPAAGVLQEIRVKEGETVPVNTVVAVIGRGRAAAASGAAPQPGSAAHPPHRRPLPAPSARAGAAAERAPPRRAAPTLPRRFRPPSAASPLRRSRCAAAAAPARRAAPSSRQLDGARPGAPPPAAAAPPAPADPRGRAGRGDAPDELRQTRSSPLVRKIAAEHNVDIREIPGTGHRRPRHQARHPRLHRDPPGAGRVARPPHRPHPGRPRRRRPAAPARRGAAASAAAPGGPGRTGPRPAARVEVVPMSPMRKKIAEHMVLSKRTSAHVHSVFEVDLTRVAQLREQVQGGVTRSAAASSSPTLPFIVKAVVDALQAFPVAQRRVDGDNIVYQKDINLGIAVALDWGLIVPVDPQRRREEPPRPGPRRQRPRRARARARSSSPTRCRAAPSRSPTPASSAPLRHADHQPAAGRHPRRRHDREAPGGARRRDRDPADVPTSP